MIGLLVLSTVSPLVKGFISRKRFPNAAIDRERMRYPNAMAIAVDFVRRTKPSDVHMAVGDLETANGEPQCSVDRNWFSSNVSVKLAAGSVAPLRPLGGTS